MDYLIEHPEVGIIKYFKNNRAKRIIISLKSDYVRVVIPRRETLKNAQQFVESKLDWIKNGMNKPISLPNSPIYSNFSGRFSYIIFYKLFYLDLSLL